MKKVVLLLGSNLDDRRNYLLKACQQIAYVIGQITKYSKIYETKSWGFDSFPFLNQVVEVETKLQPEQVLQAIETIEVQLGRLDKTHKNEEGVPIYHDRTIDIDILLYENYCCTTSRLTIPHAQMTNRTFVLQPLAELYEDTIIPPFQRSFKDLLNDLQHLQNK